MPRYTCVQTITRNSYPPPAHWRSKSCAEAVSSKEERQQSKPQSWDRLRLDVTVGNHSEIYSWAGAPKFEEDTLAKIAGGGALGSGDFGPFVNAILTSATVKFKEEKAINGRHVFEYSYEVPEGVSKYRVSDRGRKQWFITAYSGTFLLDRDDPDLVQLIARTAELRPETGKCQAVSQAEYGRVAIHGFEALIPREARLQLIGHAGDEYVNLTSYTNCREYSSKSVLRFDTPQKDAGDPYKGGPAVAGGFPPGLSFDWRMITAIDFNTAAAGDPVEAILRGPIRNKGSVLAPSGAHIHGRLVHFGQSGDFYELALQFESIDVNGTNIPFTAVLLPEFQPAVSRYYIRSGTPRQDSNRFLLPVDQARHIRLESSGKTTLPEAEEKKKDRVD